MNTEITENLFQSIDTIIQARMGELAYDKTIQCEVVDIKDGYYVVKYQAAIFKASTLVNNLKIGDIVYVTVPQGDFKQDKIIISKKIQEKITKVKTLPFLSFIKGPNLFSTNQSTTEYSIAVNTGNTSMSRPFIFTMFDGKDIAAGFTRLGIKATVNAEITTPLSSGDYGIKITIYGYDQTKKTEPYLQALANSRAAHEIARTFYLKKEDMISTNIYNTHGYQNQEKVIDISNLVIDQITVELWQDNQFLDIYDNPIENQRIYFSNLQLYLGFDAVEFEESSTRVFIYTYDGLLYNGEQESNYKKEIYSRIVQKMNDNTYRDADNLFGPNLSYIWEYYSPTSTATSNYSFKKGYEIIDFNVANPTFRALTGNLARLLNTSNTQTRNSFIFTLYNPATDVRRTSNELSFINAAYADTNITEADEKELTSFFTIDSNGYVYLGSSSLNAKPLTIENIILKGELTVLGKELLFKSEDGRQLLLKLSTTGGGYFFGTATSASNFADTSGTIYKNFEAIKNAINNNTQYNIITE